MKTHNFVLANCDTDSISFCKADQSPFTEQEQKELLTDLNSNFPEMIKWGHDGIYPCVVVLKAKNYILYDGKKITIKGSSLKSSKTEKRLKDFIGEIVQCLIFERKADIQDVYYKYVKEVFDIEDISSWCSKKTITSSVLKPSRTNERKVLEALGDRQVQMGDKHYMYYAGGGVLKLKENWSNDHDDSVLLKKLYKTLVIFRNVISIEKFKNYALKGNQEALRVLNETI